MRKKIAFSIFILLGIYLIVVLARDLWNVISVKDRMTQAEAKVEKLAEEQNRLQAELKIVETDEFVEKEARNKLLLGKEGEAVVLLPQDGLQTTDYGLQNKTVDSSQSAVDLPNWQKWLRLFWY